MNISGLDAFFGKNQTRVDSLFNSLNRDSTYYTATKTYITNTTNTNTLVQITKEKKIRNLIAYYYKR